jgi:hypothetical protein
MVSHIMWDVVEECEGWTRHDLRHSCGHSIPKPHPTEEPLAQ